MLSASAQHTRAAVTPSPGVHRGPGAVLGPPRRTPATMTRGGMGPGENRPQKLKGPFQGHSAKAGFSLT